MCLSPPGGRSPFLKPNGHKESSISVSKPNHVFFPCRTAHKCVNNFPDNQNIKTIVRATSRCVICAHCVVEIYFSAIMRQGIMEPAPICILETCKTSAHRLPAHQSSAFQSPQECCYRWPPGGATPHRLVGYGSFRGHLGPSITLKMSHPNFIS